MKLPRPKDALVAGAVLLFRRLLPRRRPRLGPAEREPVVPPGPPSPRAELLVLGLLAAGALCAVAFVVVYAVDRIPAQTQLLGLSLGLAFLFVAAALIATGKRLIVTEEIEDDYPEQEHPDEQESIGAVVDDSASRLTRRRLFKLGLLGAGGALGVALLTPLASLGPVLDLARFYETPWRRGKRLVDENGRPYRASEIEEKSLYTA